MAFNVIATVTVGTTPQGIAFGGGNAYATNRGSNTVSVIDAATNAVTATITVGTAPTGVAYGTNGYVYVANSSSSSVSVIDASTNAVTATVAVAGSQQLEGIAYGSNGYVYVTSSNGGTVSVIDASTNAVTATITVGTSPYGVAYGTNGYVYVTNEGSNTVSVIDAATNAVTATITVGTAPYGVAYGSGYVYVTNESSNTVSVIDASTNAVTATITVGTAPYGVAYGNGYVFTANYSPGTVSVIEASTNSVVATTTVGTEPIAIAYGSGYVYVANMSSNTVSVIQAASPPNAPSLTSPGNGSYIDATTNPSFTANNNSTDSANINARAMRLKASGATSYNYYNVSTGAFQSTIIWNAVNYAPGAAGTFGPISGLSNGITDNWSMADQEALANLQGPFASDFTVNMQAGPSLSINAPAGSVTTSNAPSLSYNASPASGAQVTGGQWLIYTLAATQVSGFTIDIASATIPAGAVSNVTWTGNPLTVAMQSGVSLANSTTYVAYAAITETGGIWSSTISATFTISLDQPATPTITAVASTDPVTGYAPIALTVQGHDNLLSADDASFEGSIGTVVAVANCAVAQSTAWALDGSHSLSLTSTAAGAMSARTSETVYAVEPNTVYTIMSAYHTAVTAQSCRTDISWFTSAGALISTTLGTAVTDATSGAVWSVMNATSPSNAAYAALIYNVLSTAAASEVHEVDECGLFPGDLSFLLTLLSYNPVAYWPLSDPVGTTTAQDISGSGDNGTVSGSVTFGEPGDIAAFPNETSALFDGSTGHITSVDSPSITTEFTFAILALPQGGGASGNQDLIAQRSGFNANMISVGNNSDGTFSYGISVYNGANSYSFEATHRPFDGKWHFLVFTYAPTVGGTLYLDGTAIITTAWTGNPSLGAVAFTLGGDSIGYYKGNLAMAAYTLSVLTQSQITALYNALSATGSLVEKWTRGGLVGSTQAIITRSDGEQVRAASSTAPATIPTPSQTLVVNDYEVTSGQSYTYTAQVQDVLSSSATITSPTSAPSNAAEISISDWWLVPPLDTSLAVSPFVKAYTMTQTEQSAAHIQLGQSFATVVASAMGGKDGTITVQTTTPAQWTALEALINAQQICWMTNNLGDGLYVRIGPQPGGMSSGMGNTAKQSQVKPAGTNNPTRQITLTYIEMAKP